MKHGVQDVYVCVHVCVCAHASILYVCMHVHLCVLRPGWGAIGRERGPWSGWDAAHPMAAHPRVMPPCSQFSHNNTRTVGHAWGPATPPPHPCASFHPPAPHSLPPLPSTHPLGTPLLRNEVIIEVDSLRRAGRGCGGGDSGGNEGAGRLRRWGWRKDFPFSSFDEKEQKK